MISLSAEQGDLQYCATRVRTSHNRSQSSSGLLVSSAVSGAIRNHSGFRDQGRSGVEPPDGPLFFQMHHTLVTGRAPLNDDEYMRAPRHERVADRLLKLRQIVDPAGDATATNVVKRGRDYVRRDAELAHVGGAGASQIVRAPRRDR